MFGQSSKLFVGVGGVIEELELPASLQARARLHGTICGDFWQQTLVVDFPGQRLCLSTSDGWMMARAISNHAAHHEFWAALGAAAPEHLARVRLETARALGVAENTVAQLATAVNLEKLSLVSRSHGSLLACALVSAGVHTNAMRAGVDQGQHVEGEMAGAEDGGPPPGTINILLLTNIELSAAALARSLITITEAKTAALQDMCIPSSYTPTVLATGTGTDGIVVVSGNQPPAASYTGGHARIGSLMAEAVHAAVLSSLADGHHDWLRKQSRTASRNDI